jgi:hypothetical protein
VLTGWTTPEIRCLRARSFTAFAVTLAQAKALAQRDYHAQG